MEVEVEVTGKKEDPLAVADGVKEEGKTYHGGRGRGRGKGRGGGGDDDKGGGRRRGVNGGERPPLGLTGREIGMWYKNLRIYAARGGGRGRGRGRGKGGRGKKVQEALVLSMNSRQMKNVSSVLDTLEYSEATTSTTGAAFEGSNNGKKYVSNSSYQDKDWNLRILGYKPKCYAMDNDFEDEGDIWAGLSNDDFLAIDLSETRMCSGQNKEQKDEAPNEKEDIKRKLDNTAEEGEPSTKNLRTYDLPSTPLESLRKGYLWVTDFSKQLWCELQMEYTRFLPKRVVKALETDESKKGTNIHLARELEIQEYVHIKVKSKEDRFAVKVLNLLITLKKLQRQTDLVHREVTIFGLVRGIFVMGKIDELRMNDVDFTIDIVDLKTRKFKAMPKNSQKASHSLQLMIYKQLFDDLVRGLLPRHSMATILKLDLTKELGEDIVKHITKDMRHLDFSMPPEVKWNISVLLNEIRTTAEGLPFISRLFNEYVWQEDGESFAMNEIKYDDQWLDKQALRCVSYWTGQREACGVDVEDAWKCHSCHFQDDCRWIRRFMQERIEELKRRKEKIKSDNCKRVTFTKYNNDED